MKDFIRKAMDAAAERFGGSDGVFNAANFANAVRDLSGVAQTLDGNLVRAVLDGRPDVAVMPGGHFAVVRPRAGA